MKTPSSDGVIGPENSPGAGTPYDEIPYPAGAYPQSHPDRLATLAKLFGMDPPDIRACRVLELGCADGSNLIPMACALPESKFVGVDLSARQVQAGLEAVNRLSIQNIELLHQDLREVDETFGMFDYIIAHGVYSWVSSDVRNKILSICKERLYENGVAYISYNTYPGWRMRGMLRDMMLYHSRKFDDPKVQIEQARALIQWLGESVHVEGNPYGMLLQSELENMRSWQDTYFRHDSLEEINEPVYFFEFMERAERQGLTYLAEADFPMMFAGNCGSAVYETLERLGHNIIEREQYMDFLRNRMFRQTLLCHKSRSLCRELEPASLVGLRCAASLKPQNPASVISSDTEETFVGPGCRMISSKEPIVKAALVYLAEQWPASADVSELVDIARERIKTASALEPDDKPAEQLLKVALLTCFSHGLCDLHFQSVPFEPHAGDRPKACDWVRYMASRRNIVTNRRHESVVLDTFEQELVSLLDGSRDRESLTEALTALAVSGALVVEAEEKHVNDPAELREIMAKVLPEKLREFGRNALLVG